MAERLGFRYVDEEVVARAAEKGGVDLELVQDSEQRKSRLRRLIEEYARTGVAHAPSEQPPKTEEHRALIRDVVAELGEQGDAVIVAHAASHALAGREGILRVLVTASPEARARRLAADGAGDAEKRIRDGDAARADYLERFYAVDHELPTHYDLVVNTGTLAPEQAADLIVRAAELRV